MSEWTRAGKQGPAQELQCDWGLEYTWGIVGLGLKIREGQTLNASNVISPESVYKWVGEEDFSST